MLSNSRSPIGEQDLRTILFSSKSRGRVEYLRTLPKGCREFDAIKHSLPCFTPSGVFARRNKAGLLRHSGFLCIEWDDFDPDTLKARLAEHSFIHYAGLSCSGKGVFALVRIADPQLHRAYFDALRRFFEERGMPMDGSGSDVTRLRVASYDPAPVFNPDATVWDRTLPAPGRPPIIAKGNADSQQRAFLRGLDYLQKHGIDITVGRNNWLALGSTIKTYFGETGEEYFVALSRYHPRFSEWECRQTYRTLLSGGFSLGVFAAACTRAGVPNLKSLIQP